MRSFMKLILTVVVMAGLAIPAFAAIDPADIIGIWTFDEGSGAIAADSSGNGRDGELVGNANWVAGKSGSAIEFSGGNVTVAPDDAMSLNNFSMTLWVNIPGATDTFQYAIGKEAWPARNYAMWILPDVMTTGITSGDSDIQTPGGVAADGSWHHLASTYNGEVLRAYVDGVVTGEVALSGTPNVDSAAPLMIGAQPPAGGGPVMGVIDEVGVFSVGLSAEDVQSIMANGLNMLVTAVEPGSKLCTVWGALKDID